MYLCLVCKTELDPNDPRLMDEQHPYFGNCPECGCEARGADLDDTVEIKITWTELRLLIMWAEMWANHIHDEVEWSQKIFYNIVDRIQMQYMERPGLTFASELTKLREEYGDDSVFIEGFKEPPLE